MLREPSEQNRLCLLGLAAAEGLGPVTLNRLVAGAERAGLALGDALALPGQELRRRFGIRARFVHRLKAVRAPAASGKALAGELAAVGARPVFAWSAEYPSMLLRCLGEGAPPVLFVQGSVGILRSPCVGIVGSRTPSGGARAAASVLAAQLAAAGMTVVSGGAAGIDAAAHKAALGTGATAAVPPVGIARFRWRGVGLRRPAGERWCVLGQFPPLEGWKTANALARNRTIVALSSAVVAFEPRDTGGTWNSCVAALRMGKPLFVASSRATPPLRRGLRALVRMGACALDIERMPDAEEVQELMHRHGPRTRAAQARLFPQSGGGA